MKKVGYKFLRISLLIIFPLFLGLAPRGCALLEVLFFYNCVQIPPNLLNTNSSGSWSDLGSIYVGDEGNIYIPDSLCSSGYFLSTVPGNPDLNAVTLFYNGIVGSIVVGEQGTIVQVDPNYQINGILNPAGSYNLNAIEQDGFGPNVIAVGDSGTIIKSIDNGLTWEVVDFPFNINLNEVYYFEDRITVVGEGSYRTTDGGANWQGIAIGKNVSPSAGPLVFNDIFFVDDNTGYIGGDFGLLGKTTDGGQTWGTLVASGFSGEQITSILFISPDSGVVAGTNGIARFTTDGGLTWEEDPEITMMLAGRTVNAVNIFESNYGLIVGDDSLNIIFSPDSNLITSTEYEEMENPNEYDLSYNYPNPFNPSTKIQFHVSNVGLVQLKVYDILGNEVATLVNEKKPAGNYEVEFNAYGLSSGVYFYRLTSGEFIETKKLVLMK